MERMGKDRQEGRGVDWTGMERTGQEGQEGRGVAGIGMEGRGWERRGANWPDRMTISPLDTIHAFC